jgi:hypothetical protein
MKPSGRSSIIVLRVDLHRILTHPDGLIETAKANCIEPHAYLRTVFTELPNAKSVEAIEALLPVPVPADDDSLATIS